MFLLFDIGGTKTRIALSKDGKEIDSFEVLPTPHNFEEGLVLIEKTAQRLSKGEKITAVSGGTASPIDKEKSKMILAPNLPGWREKPIKERLSEIFNTPVFLENDAALAGLGEAVYGAGVDYDVVAYLTISTGVGGSRIVNKNIDQNAFGFEPGHQIVDAEGNDFEFYVSGSGIKKRFGKEATEIDDEKIWDDIMKWLTFGINNTVAYWSPEIIILGGGIMQSKYISIDKIKSFFKESSKLPMPEIKLASLGDKSAIFGALALLN